jgi:CMP-N,N'-diacetyllegionaminic acid synthase
MILGVIYCRDGNRGMPNKNIQLLNGKPLIAYAIENARHCNLLSDVIVVTDNHDIAEVAMQNGAKVPFMLPSHAGHVTAWSELLNVLETYEKEAGKEVSYVVDIDVMVPLTTAADMEGAVRLALQHPETDVVATGYASPNNPYFNMVELTKNGYAEIAKREYEPITRLKDAPKVFSLSGIFVIKKSAFYNYSHWSQAVCRVYEIPHTRALNVDDEVNFELIKLLLHRQESI